MDRLSIAICEDDPRDAAHLRDTLTSLDLSIEPYFFSDCTSLRESFEPGFFQLALLDILFDGKPKGINLAKSLRKSDVDLWIVFTTITPEYAIDGYDVAARGYLLKPVDGDDLSKLLSRARSHFRTIHNELIVTIDYQHVPIKTQDIFFIEARRNQCLIHLADTTLATTRTISEIEQQLPRLLFLRTHRSFLVNLAHVKKMDGERRLFVLDNDDTVKVGIKNCAESFGAYREYLSRIAVL